MKLIKFIIIFGCLNLALTLHLNAQPLIMFPHGTTYDWGKVKPKDNPLNAEIVIGNAGKDTLKITKVQPTCGCTTAPLLKDILAPGETTSMMVTLSIGNYDGPIHKTIRIYSNDTSQREIDVNLKALIQRDIFVTPSSFISFNELKVGEMGKQMLAINNNSEKDITIMVGNLTPKSIQLKLRDGQIIKKGETYPLEVSITPSEPGILKGKILLLTSNSDFPEIPIFVFGDIKNSPLFIGQ